MARDELLQALQDLAGQAEIVGGQLVALPIHSAAAGIAIAEILMHLAAQHDHNGHALGGEMAYLVDLPGRASFSPDASYYEGAFSGVLIHGAPLLAIEVRSPQEQGAAAEAGLAAKRGEYFAAGARQVWDVDVDREEIIRAYDAQQPDTPVVYGRGDLAAAEAILPGWRLPVDEILPAYMAA